MTTGSGRNTLKFSNEDFKFLDQRVTNNDIRLTSFERNIQNWSTFRERYESTRCLYGLINAENLLQLQVSLKDDVGRMPFLSCTRTC
jgi:hypothetical protein